MQINKVNNFIFEEVDVLIKDKIEKTYQVQKRRGMNKRLAYQSNLKNLSKIGGVPFDRENLFGNEYKSRGAKGGQGDSDEEKNNEEATGTDDERASSESMRSAGARSERILD